MIYPASFTRTGAWRLQGLCALTILTVVALPGADTLSTNSNQGRTVSPQERLRLEDTFGKLPLRFEPNRGQAENRARFFSRGPGYRIAFTDTAADIALMTGNKQSVIRMTLEGAQPPRQIRTLEPLAGATNYFIKNDNARWKTNIPGYGRLRYDEVYAGIDLDYYGSQRRLEYDFTVSPGADPEAIRLRFEGVSGLRIDSTGDLLLETPAGPLRQHRPVVYQEIGGRRVAREGAYRIRDGVVSFAIGTYDRSAPLVIDPILSYSTFLGGASSDAAYAIAVDGSNNVYITGATISTDLSKPGAAQAGYGGAQDAFVAKLNASGGTVGYITYLGGTGEDTGTSIAVDSTGAAYVAGFTFSTNFPTSSPFQAANAGSADAFVAKLSANGDVLTYSSYLGGANDDRGLGIAIDSTGAAYVAGATASPNFPMAAPIVGAFAGGARDGFVSKIATGGGSLVFSTYLGGSGDDSATAVAANVTGVYVVGTTTSTNFPVAAAIRGTAAGGVDAFLTKLPLSGTTLTYSTYLGGTLDDRATAVAVDGTGAAFVAGWTFSTNYPTVSAAYGTFRGGIYDSFVTKVNAAGTGYDWSTFLGGNGEDYISGIAVDSTGAAAVTGYTSSSDFPLVSSSGAYYGNVTSGAFVARFAAGGASLNFGTYFGGATTDQAYGVAVDSSNAIYITGTTQNANFPAVAAYQSTLSGGSDAFVAKFVEGTPVTFTVDTNPTGLSVIVDGISAAAPRFFAWAASSTHTLDTNSPQVLINGTRYSFSSWSQGGAKSQTVTAGTSSASYTANFTTQYQLNVATIPASGGSVVASPSSADNYYNAGASVTLTATPVAGYSFAGFTGDVTGTSPLNVTMSAARNITATFACNYILSSNAASFDGSAGNGNFTITTGASCPFTASSNAAFLTINSGGAGPGTQTLSYSLAANTGTTSRTGVITILTGSTQYTFTVTQGPIPPASVSITTVPAGLQVVINGTTMNSPANAQFPPSTQVTISAPTVQGDASTRFVFSSWSDGGAQTHNVTIPATGSVVVTANFITQYKLNLVSSPSGSGTFTTNPTSTDGFFAPNTPVAVTAVPAVGAQFNGFSGALAGTTNPQTVTVTQPLTVTGTFTPQVCGSAYSLDPQTIAAPPEGGTFAVNVTTAAGCFWTTTLSNFFVTPFITINGAGQGAGSGSFTFTLQPNGSQNPRTGSINVQGQLVQVLQKGVLTPQPYTDVPSSHIFFDYIYLAGLFGEMTGCGGGNFCPDTVTTRARMAEFVIKAKLGNDFLYTTTPFFTDVPATHPQFSYIQKMKDLGITVGCSATEYCPNQPVTRGEISVFLIRGKLNIQTATQFPFNPTAYFTDMPANDSFFPFIQKMKDLGITAGCSTTTFCPGEPNTWGQIAVFIIRAFNTP